ncbi:MAG: polysaccharide deacetylase family protein, partial [Candidatus Limnocylindrales bacterium]
MRDETAARIVTGLARGPVAATLVHGLERLAPWRRGMLAILTYHRVDEPSTRPELLPGLISATPAAFAAQVDDLARHYAPVSLAQVLDALEEPRRLPARAVLVTFDDAYADFAEHAWPVLRAAAVPATMFVPTAYPDQDRGFWWDRLWHALATTTRDEVPDSPPGTLPLRTPTERAAAMAILRDRLKGRPHDAAMSELDDLVAALSASAEPGATAGPGPSRNAVLGWDELRRLAAEGLTLAPHTRHHPLLDRVPLE